MFGDDGADRAAADFGGNLLGCRHVGEKVEVRGACISRTCRARLTLGWGRFAAGSLSLGACEEADESFLQRRGTKEAAGDARQDHLPGRWWRS
jgi:hypothetical protein